MKSDADKHLLAPASREKRDVWEQFRNDHELIERLRISPHELDLLGKSALLGTLTCKQDLLFILRQIREATGSGTHPTVFASAPASTYEEVDEGPAPDLARIRTRLAPSAETLAHPASLTGIVPRRVPEQFGGVFWAIVLAVGLVLSLAIAASRWGISLRSTILGSPVAAGAPATHAWFMRIDEFKILVGWEIMFVAGVTATIFLLSRRRPRRFKVKPM